MVRDSIRRKLYVLEWIKNYEDRSSIHDNTNNDKKCLLIWFRKRTQGPYRFLSLNVERSKS